MASSEMEVLEADIKAKQSELRELHAAKRRVAAAQRAEVIRAEGQVAKHNNLELASSVQVGTLQPNELSGFPTSSAHVDMSQAQPVLVNTALGEAEPPEPNPLSERDQRFLEGALPSEHQRGPQMVTLFPRRRGV